jgi:hypothetical protein
MGQVYLTNVTGADVTVATFSINSQTLVTDQPLSFATTLKSAYDGKGWNEYQDMILQVKMLDVNYRVDLNRDHYFGGGDYHYPGRGSDVDFILQGVDSQLTSIRFLLTYRQAGAQTLIYSTDSKNLNQE